MPGWVVDYVVLHELAHLLEPSHSARFWQLLQGYPKLERARGYLEGVAAAAELDMEPMGEAADGALPDCHPPARLDPPGRPGALDPREPLSQPDPLIEREVAAKFSGDNPPEQPTLL